MPLRWYVNTTFIFNLANENKKYEETLITFIFWNYSWEH